MSTLKKNNSVPARPPRHPRGFALAFTLFALLIISVIGLGIASILIGGQKGSFSFFNNTRALYCAKAGISRAIGELESNPAWTGKTENMGSGSYIVTAAPDPNNATRVLRQWRVASTGTSGGSTRTLTVYLQDASFADYAYFTDIEQSSGGSTIWFFSRDQLTGNVHTNGYFSMSGTPQFATQVTSAQGVIDGPLDPDYAPSTGIYTQGGSTTDPAKFYHYQSSYANDRPTALNGSPLFAFAGAQPNVPLPSSLTSISSHATQTFTGDCRMSLQSNGTAIVSGCSPAGTYNISSSYGNVFYVNGNVNVSGTLKGRLTIGTSEDMHITNNILYADKNTDILGLAATDNIWLDADPNTVANFEIDAEMMALNTSFSVSNYNRGVARGTLTIYGGVIQKNRGPVGTLNNNTLQTGYSKNYIYDNTLKNKPPPNFPTTGQIVIKQWTDSSALGH